MTSATAAGSMTYGTLSYYFILTDVPTYTELTSLFDQYKVDRLTLKLYSYATSVTVGAAVSSNYPQSGIIVHDVVDYDDAALPTGSDAGVQELREYQNYKCRNLINAAGAPVTRSWAPHLAVAAYSGAFSSYKNEPFGWVDCASATVQGYGWKCILEQVSPGATMNVTFKVEVTADLSFRNVR